MRFFSHPPEISSPLFLGNTADNARRWRFFERTSDVFSTPNAPDNQPALAANEGVHLGSDQAGGRWLFVRIDRIEEIGYFTLVPNGNSDILRDGRVRQFGLIPLAAGMHAYFIPAGQGFSIYANAVHLSGIGLFNQIGALTAHPPIDADTVPRQTVKYALNKTAHVTKYGQKLSLEIDANGALPTADTDLLESLNNDYDRFWVWPHGGVVDESGHASWSKRDLFVPVQVSRFSGWNGEGGRAIGGATGTISFAETSASLTSADYTQPDPNAPDQTQRTIHFALYNGTHKQRLFGTRVRVVSGQACEIHFPRLDLGPNDILYLETTGATTDEAAAWRFYMNGYEVTRNFVRQSGVGANFLYNQTAQRAGIMDFEIV